MTPSNPPATPRALAALLVTAVVIKGVYLAQYLQLPIFDGPAFDSLAYLRQASAVSRGLYGDASLLAFSPLYGYVLALLHASDGLARTVVVQLLLGCVNLIALYVVTERVFDRRAALVSGALYLGYGLLAFYETKVLAETLGLSLSLLALVLLTAPGFVAGRLGHALAAGVVLALSVLARANQLFVLPFALLTTLVPWTPAVDHAWRPRVLRCLGVALGVALVLGGHGAWNYRNTGFFVPIIFRSATASRATAAGEWTGSLSQFSTREDGDVGVFDVMRQAQARLEGRAPIAGGVVDAGIDWLGVLRGAPTKLVATFRSVETDFQYGYYGERSEVPIFALMFVSFGMLATLSSVGLLMLWRSERARWLWVLLPWACGALATVLLFHPSSRYRLPIVLPMLVLSGVAVSALAQMPRDRRFWGATSALVLLCAYFSYGTLNYRLVEPAMWHLRMAESAIAGWNHEEAERRIARAEQLAGHKPKIQHRIAYLRRQLPGSSAD